MKLQGMSIDELQDMGLDVHDIAIHQERIQTSATKHESLFIPIIDTCRLENRGVVPSCYLKAKTEATVDGYVAFVPAAGAASRYFKPLQDLRTALCRQDQQAIDQELANLHAEGAAHWPLPEKLALLLGDKTPKKISPSDYATLLAEIDIPKALLPHKKGAETFLQKKQDEHTKLRGLIGQVFIAPLGQTERFAGTLSADGTKNALPTLFLEQGSKLSTIRFLANGSPYRDASGDLSVVPAGHGMLVKLFPEIHRQFPRAHSLFIRNIDNVNGSDQEVLDQSELFLQQHQSLLYDLQTIRKCLHEDSLGDAGRHASETLNQFLYPRPLPPLSWLHELEEPWRSLWHLLIQGCHCPPAYATEQRNSLGDKKALRQLFDRPLNTLGQVPNSGRDIGGSPVFARTDNGEVVICLELPHVSNADRQRFLENSKLATHFNPVFVAAEIPQQHHAYDLKRCPFWILAEKSLHGQAVVYHETVLYEILGNSLTCNVIFPEIPRLLFSPHKTLTD